ncbi:MAG: PHP domain-containing protein [Treponemataceae bacterium]
MIDLHTHSTFSDGEYSPKELVFMAAEKGISVLALTDHDTLDGIEEAKSAAHEKGITFVPGVELTVEWPTGEFHLLGLGLQKISSSMKDLLLIQQQERCLRNEKIIQRINECFSEKFKEPVTLEQLEKLYGSKNIGRPHIARFFVENKIVKTGQKAFDLFLAKNRPFYSKINGSNLDKAIVAIQDCGGIPVLAHPLSLYLSWGKLEEVFIDLRQRGIEGIEAWHSGTKLGEANRLEMLAKKLGFFVTGGSDFHGEKTRKDRKLGYTAGGMKIDDRFWTENLKPKLKENFMSVDF